MIDFKQLQKEVFENKVKKGFNTTDVNMEFALTYGELAEAHDSYIKQKGDVGEELADVFIYLLGLAEILKVDLEAEVFKKVEKNKTRVYEKVNGVLSKKEE